MATVPHHLRPRAHWKAWRKVADAEKPGGGETRLCEICGAEAQAHHHDYEQPLDVVWLCQRHHSLAHKTMARKTDNADLAVKLELRRALLDGLAPAALVFDAAAGEGVLWGVLGRELDVRVFGVDRKRKKGRLSIDSLRILQQPGLPYDVIDLDVYGSPWRHYYAALRNAARAELRIFLTAGSAGLHGSLDREAWEVLGVTRPEMVPAGFGARLSRWAAPHLLGAAVSLGWTIEQRLESSAGRALYYGVRLEKT